MLHHSLTRELRTLESDGLARVQAAAAVRYSAPRRSPDHAARVKAPWPMTARAPSNPKTQGYREVSVM